MTPCEKFPAFRKTLRFVETSAVTHTATYTRRLESSAVAVYVTAAFGEWTCGCGCAFPHKGVLYVPRTRKSCPDNDGQFVRSAGDVVPLWSFTVRPRLAGEESDIAWALGGEIVVGCTLKKGRSCHCPRHEGV